MIQEADEIEIRKYLLGQLAEEGQARVEERLMAEDDYFNLLEVAEDELIEDRLNGELTQAEQERFDAYFLSTPERCQKFEFAEMLKEYVSRKTRKKNKKTKALSLAWWNPSFSNPYLQGAAAAIIIIGLGLLIIPLIYRPSEASKGVAALKEAYGSERPVEARIAEFEHAPLPPVTRGDNKEKFDYVARDRASALIQEAVKNRPDAESYHALGLLYLTNHELDKAIDQLEKALQLDEKNAKFENDLGVALLEKGRAAHDKEESGKSLEEFARALEHFNKAVEIDGSLLEALFNRALCRQKMRLFQQAEADWQAYLEKDPNSKWADDARHYLKTIEEQKQKSSQSKEQILQDFINAYESRDDERAWNIACQSREALSGKIISEQLLDKYLETSTTGQSKEANAELQALSYVGEQEAERTGELYTSHLKEFCRSLSPEQTRLLAQARGLIKSGHESYRRNATVDAIGFYTKAKQIFDGLHDECESLFAQHWIGFCYREVGKTEQSLAILEPLAQTCEQKKYKWLCMRTLLLISSAQYNFNEYSKAIDYASRSLKLAEQIGDTIGIFNAYSVLIEEYRYINNSHQSLRCAQESLAVIDSCLLNPIQIGRHYGIVASAFDTFGFYTAAIDYQKEMVRQALSIRHAQLTTLAYANLGLIYAKSGRLQEALDTAELACEVARSTADETIRKHMMAYSAMQKASIYRERGDWEKATESYDESISIYDSMDFRYYAYQAHKGRLSCYIAQGADSLAKEEIQKTIDLAEKYRSTILEGDNRNNFYEMEQSVYDLAIDFEYTRMNESRKAYDYSEKPRARSLLDLMKASGKVLIKDGVPDTSFAFPFQPLSLDDIQQDMPDQTQIIQYAVLDDKLFIWLISKNNSSDNYRAEEKAITQKELAEKCRRFLELSSSPSEGADEDERNAAKELFDILIKPVESGLDKNKQLCIVADKALNYLPFGALISSSNQYLLKEYHLLHSPSSSVFVACSKTAREKGGMKLEKLLSIGNPNFDREAFPLLADLDSAAKEAKQIAAYYESSCPLIGNNARKARVMDEMKKADVIHFALHSVADPRSPLRSKLVLAKEPSEGNSDPGSEAVLEACEIYGLKLARPRLVVLSACETGLDRYYPGEGMLNITRPFLVAGVPLTIASLWQVSSDLTAELMVKFHWHRTRGKLSSVDALRQAQIDMIDSPQAQLRRPYCWASFIAIGGYAIY